jgi:hypothetical protein
LASKQNPFNPLNSFGGAKTKEIVRRTLEKDAKEEKKRYLLNLHVSFLISSINAYSDVFI